MALSQPRSVFGVHSVAPYSRTTGLYYGIMEVLESSSVSLNAEQVDLYGGSNKYPWASEDGNISAEMSLKVSQLEDFMFELFLGKAPTATTAETAGNITTLTNKYGTSIVAATGLLGTITASTAADLKFGKYVIKATGAAAFDLFMSTDIDHARGTDASYSSDLLKVAAVSGVATGAGSVISGHGITVTGGASATAFTTGDTATFEVRPINSKSSVVNIGAAADVFPEFGCIIMAQRRSGDEFFELDAYRCKASGMPINFETKAWNKPEVKAKLLYDSAKDGVFKVRATAV